METRIRCALAVLGAMAIATATASVQPVLAQLDSAGPCCAITAIDLKTGVVNAMDLSAVDKATKRTFQFTVTDAAVLKTLKLGQSTYADFKTMKASLNPGASSARFNVVNLKTESWTNAPAASLAKVPVKAKPKAELPGKGAPPGGGGTVIDGNCVEAWKEQCRADCLQRYWGPGNTQDRERCYDVCNSVSPEGLAQCRRDRPR